MSNDRNKVSTGKPKITGAVFCAPLGTTLPTSPDDTLNAAFKNMGYISDAGITNSKTRDTTEIKAWGGDVVAVTQDKKTDQFKMKFIEVLNQDMLKVVYGDSNVVGTDLATGIALHENSNELGHYAWVIDRILTNGVRSRTVIADGQPTSIEDVSYVDNDVIGYDTTIQAYPATALNGDTHIEYLKSAASGQSGSSGSSGTSGTSGA